MSLYSNVAPIAKSVTGALVAGLGALGTALTDGVVSPAEWVAVVSATLVASYAIWQIPNEETPEQKLGAEALAEKREFEAAEANPEFDDYNF